MLTGNRPSTASVTSAGIVQTLITAPNASRRPQRTTRDTGSKRFTKQSHVSREVANPRVSESMTVAAEHMAALIEEHIVQCMY